MMILMSDLDENCFDNTEDQFAFDMFDYIKKAKSYDKIMYNLKDVEEFKDILIRINKTLKKNINYVKLILYNQLQSNH